jgi:hypothetical protein
MFFYANGPGCQGSMQNFPTVLTKEPLHKLSALVYHTHMGGAGLQQWWA